jgi:hypothetical protein
MHFSLATALGHILTLPREQHYRFPHRCTAGLRACRIAGFQTRMPPTARIAPMITQSLLPRFCIIAAMSTSILPMILFFRIGFVSHANTFEKSTSGIGAAFSGVAPKKLSALFPSLRVALTLRRLFSPRLTFVL